MAGFYTGKLIKLPGFQLVEQFNFFNAGFKTETITQAPSTYYQLIPVSSGVTASNSNNAFFNNHAIRNTVSSFPKIYLYLNSTWPTSPGCCVEIRFQHDCDLVHWSSMKGWEPMYYNETTPIKYKSVYEEHYFLYSLDREYLFYTKGYKNPTQNIFETYTTRSYSEFIHVIWKDKKTIQFWMAFAYGSNSDAYIVRNSSSGTGNAIFTFDPDMVFATPLEGYQYLTT